MSNYNNNNIVDPIKDILSRLCELETKITFQDALIDELNDVVTMQSNDIEKLKTAIKFLQGKLKECNVSNVALPSEETPPPHY